MVAKVGYEMKNHILGYMKCRKCKLGFYDTHKFELHMSLVHDINDLMVMQSDIGGIGHWSTVHGDLFNATRTSKGRYCLLYG